MLELGAALLLAVTAPVAAPLVPIADQSAVRGQRRAGAMAVFDLRRLKSVAIASRGARQASPAEFPPAAVRREDTEYRIATLVAADREAQYTGRRTRGSAMAAGVSLRMTNDDGVLASQVGMAGAVGKALARMALEVVTPE